MDNPLTPNKIQRLMHLAEDKSFNVPRRLLLNDEDVKRLALHHNIVNKSSTNTNCEASSGILDLEKMEGFGDSEMDNMSLSKSSAFNPGEMTGRSTGTEDVVVNPSASVSVQGYEEYGRHSLALDSLQSHMDKQTLEINDIMRHSIATNYSFHSKRDLTADEASLVIREAPLPVPQSTQTNFHDSIMNHSNLSVGAYFKNRCPEFGRILSKTDSPDRLIQTNTTGVSSHNTMESSNKISNHTFKLDNTLDSIPVRQPKFVNNENEIEKFTLNSHTSEKVPDKKNQSIAEASCLRNVEAPKSDCANKGLNISSISLVSGSTKNVNQMTHGLKATGMKSFMTSSKPTDVLLRNLQSSLRMVAEDTEASMENSLSISKIADYLGKQSNISVTDMLQLNNQTKHANRKQPLTELHINMLENKRVNQNVLVTHLKDTKYTETTSSSGTMNTVISLDKLKLNDGNVIPEASVTQDIVVTSSDGNNDWEEPKTDSVARSKSPSSKSQSTLSTVHENIISFKSGDSPSQSRKGESHLLNIPSPNIGYKELDKSVDWLEVLQQKRSQEECLAKEKWVDIEMSSATGFVGVSCPVTITMSTLIDSWLTAKVEFNDLPDGEQDLVIELPRFPLLLSPGKTEQFTLHLTSNAEINTKLPYTVHLKDASIDGDSEQMGFLEVNIKMPSIQAISCDGVNKICFPVTQANSSITKYFVLISDCPVDLKLELAITEGEGMFVIKNVQEIKRNEVSKALMERQSSVEDQQSGKPKGKGKNKQLCRIANDNAIKVTITFNSPNISDLELTEETATFSGNLNVNLIGSKTSLKQVSIGGAVGVPKLAIERPSSGRLHLSNEPVSISLCNAGPVGGCWVVKFHSATFTESNFPFRVSPAKLEIPPAGAAKLNVMYTGTNDSLCEATLILQEVASGAKSTLEIIGGSERRAFPIKTSCSAMSWVRAGRRELSLKNCGARRVVARCRVLGEGFAAEPPGAHCLALALAPGECRTLPVVFAPATGAPHVAALHIVIDNTAEFSRKIKLHGCASEAALRWSGLVTYGDTALVRAQPRAPIELALFNKARAPAFVAATVHFNVQYACMAAGARVAGARRVVAARGRHALALRLDWARLERRARASRAPALATVTVLAGPECTRRRILRILKSESSTGEPDTSLLPDHLKVLTEQFEGEDPDLDKQLENFRETKASLDELIESLQELTAQIDLPQDFAEENTIIISDDTMVEHHTLCD